MLSDYDPAPKLPTTRRERGILLLLGGAFTLLLLAEVLNDYMPAKLGILFMLLWRGPLLALHEMGHYWAARSVGWRVSEIVIGYGHELSRFRIGMTRVSLRMLPIEGYVIPSPNSTEGARYKSAFIYAAGPGIELLLLLGLWGVMGERLITPSTGVGILCAQSLAISILVDAVFNLLPMAVGGSVNDGLGILSSAFVPAQVFAQRLTYPFSRRAERLLDAERFEAAAGVVSEGLALYPGDTALLGLAATCRAARGEPAAAYTELERLGPPEKHPPAIEASLLSSAAWAVLLSGDAASLIDAQRAIQRALERVPLDARYRLLYGQILYEQGRVRPAFDNLMQAFRLARDVDLERHCMAHLALVTHQLATETDDPKMFDYHRRFLAALVGASLGPKLKSRLERLGARPQRSN